LIRKFARSGGAVLLATEELDELVSLSTRVIVLSGGAQVGEVQASEGRMQDIGRMKVQGVAA